MAKLMYELDKGAFLSVRHLVGNGTTYPEVLAVIDGNNPGWVFVDSPTRPGTALIWSRGIEGFYLIGEQDDATFLVDLDSCVDAVISPRARELGMRWFEFSCDRESWGSAVERVFGRRGLVRSTQYTYGLEAHDYGRLEGPLPQVDCGVRAMDSDLMTSKVENIGFALSKISRFWGAPEAFFRRGLGCAVLADGEIASVCLSAFVADDVHTVDVETEERHRRKGFGERAAREFVELCLKRGLRPHWDCMGQNVASWSLAEKLGFQRSGEYSLWAFPL
jgi:GNAT superfamily N-acetyltransferase